MVRVAKRHDGAHFPSHFQDAVHFGDSSLWIRDMFEQRGTRDAVTGTFQEGQP